MDVMKKPLFVEGNSKTTGFVVEFEKGWFMDTPNDNASTLKVTYYSAEHGESQEVFRAESISDWRTFPYYHNFSKTLLQVFSQIFEFVSPLEMDENFVPVMAFGSHSRMDLIRWVESLEITEVERVFYWYLMANANGVNTREYAPIIASHIEEFNRTVFDTKDKINAAVNPWNGQLGFSNFKILKSFTVDQELLNTIKLSGLIEEFKKYVVILGVDFPMYNIVGNLKIDNWVSQIRNNNHNQKLDEFFTLPLRDKLFWDTLDTMTIGNAVRFLNSVSCEIPNSLFMEWMFHEVKSYDSSYSNETINKVKKIQKNIFGFSWRMCKEDTTVNRSLMNWLKKAAEKHSAFRESIEDVILSNEWESLVELERTLFTVGSRNENPTWINPMCASDFLLKRLYENLGPVKMWSLISRVLDSDEYLTITQWLWMIDHHEEVIHVPASWWASLAGDE